jgi:hypothetical protein
VPQRFRCGDRVDHKAVDPLSSGFRERNLDGLVDEIERIRKDQTAFEVLAKRLLVDPGFDRTDNVVTKERASKDGDGRPSSGTQQGAEI